MQGDWPTADDHAAISEPVTDGSETEVKHVTLVRLLTDDPCNGHDAGTELFRPGLYENGENYEVMTDDGGVATVETATVDVFTFSKPLPVGDALDRAVEWADDRPDVATDGGEPEYVPVLLVAYEPDADLDIDNSGEHPRVQNHDALVENGDTYDEIRMLKRLAVQQHLDESDIVREGDSLWCEAVADLEPGEAVRVDELSEVYD